MPRPFVLLNIPKTGTLYISALVRNADLLSLLRLPALRNMLSGSGPWAVDVPHQIHTILRRLRILRSGYMNSREHHMFYHQLPHKMRSLPAVSILRDPLSWHISRYLHITEPQYGGYMYTHRNLQLIDRLLHQPQAPQHQAAAFFLEKYMNGKLTPETWQALSLEGLYYFTRHFSKSNAVKTVFPAGAAPSYPLGMLGCRTLMFVHRDPQRLFSIPPPEVEKYFADGRWRKDLCRVWFLRQEQLREDLHYVMLERLGYHRKVLDIAERLTPAGLNTANPDRKKRVLRELEQKPQLRADILHDERLYSEHLLPLAGNFRAA